MNRAPRWSTLPVRGNSGESERNAVTTLTDTHPNFQTTGSGHLDVSVREIMNPAVVTISEDASLFQVNRALASRGVQALLVVGQTEGRPLGWITARGLLAWCEADISIISAREAITERATTIEPGASARAAVLALSQPNVTHLLVCRRPGDTPEGVVSAIDVVKLSGGR